MLFRGLVEVIRRRLQPELLQSWIGDVLVAGVVLFGAAPLVRCFGSGELAAPLLSSFGSGELAAPRRQSLLRSQARCAIGVGMAIAGHPLRGSRRTALPYRALALRHDGRQHP